MTALRRSLVLALILTASCGKNTPTDKSPSDSATSDSATEDTAAPEDTAETADTSEREDTDDTADTGDTEDLSGGLSYSWPELELDEADLAFTSTWTNGPCPEDTLIDLEGAHWDYRMTEGRFVDFADDLPVLTDAYGLDTWYGAEVWKVQTTLLELQLDGVTVYSSTVRTSYYACEEDGVHLVGVETSYHDPAYHDTSATVFNPPPLVLPTDRTVGTTWSVEVSWDRWWWNERAYPDDTGYESGTETVSGEVVEAGSLTVSTGAYDALEVTAGDTSTWWVDGVGPARFTTALGSWEGQYDLVWMSTP